MGRFAKVAKGERRAPSGGSFLHDFPEGHPTANLRDSDLDLVADPGARNEDDKVLNACDAVALSSDVLDLGVVNLALFDRDGRRPKPGPGE